MRTHSRRRAALSLAGCAKGSKRRGGIRLGGRCGAESRVGQRRRGRLSRQLLELPPGRRYAASPARFRRSPAIRRLPAIPIAVIAIVKDGLDGTTGRQRPVLQRNHAALEGAAHRRADRRGLSVHPQLVEESRARRKRRRGERSNRDGSAILRRSKRVRRTRARKARSTKSCMPGSAWRRRARVARGQGEAGSLASTYARSDSAKYSSTPVAA